MSGFKVFNCIFLVFFMIETVVNVHTEDRKYDIEFLVDLMGRLNHSNTVLTHLCWNKDDLVALSRKLSYILMSHNLVSNYPANEIVDVKYKHKIFVLNISCEGSVEYITENLRNNIFDPISVWIIFAELSGIKIYDWSFLINSLVYIVDKENLHYSVKIVCKYNKKAHSEYDVVDIAAWKPEKGFIYFNRFSLLTNRTNLKRSSIRVTYVLNDNDTLKHLWDYRKIHVDKLTKANYIIVSYVLELINATKIDVWANTWGYRNEVTNLYNGMYGDLMLDRADLAATPGFIQTSRLEHFKFIPPTSPARVLFIFQAPPLSHTSNLFLLPFNSTTLAIFFLLITLSSILIYSSAIFQWKLTSETNNLEKKCKPKICDVVLLECSALTQRGSNFEPNTNSGRIVFYWTFLLCLYMYVGFSGYIVVLLQSTSESITDVASLYDSKIDIGVEDTPYNRYYFTTPSDLTNETYRQLLFETRVAPTDNWFTPREGVERVRKGFFAFHVEIGTAYALIREIFKENEKCKIRESYTIFKSGDSFVAVPRNSVYTEMFLVGFRRIFETGLQKREHLKYFFTKPQCIGRQGNYDSIRLLDCYFPFLILVYGVVISCLILIFEIIVSRLNVKKV